MRRGLAILLASACALAACGRVGPPVRSRPEPKPAAAVQPATSAPTDAEQSEQTEEDEKR